MVRRAFITGASSGIGAALAEALWKRGDFVAVAARRSGMLEDLARRHDPSGQRSLVIALDVAATDTILPALEEAKRTFGGLDLVIANAGMGIPSPALELRLEDLRSVFEINLFGAVETLRAGFELVPKDGNGVLVGISSMAAWRCGPGAAPYNASKAAFTSMMEGFRPEYEAAGVRLLEVNPGFVKTPLTDRNSFKMPFLVDPGFAARKILKAVDKRRRRLAFPLRALFVMALLRRLPDGVFDALSRRITRRLKDQRILGRSKREGLEGNPSD